MKIFSALYDRVLRWAAHPYAERYLAGLSFAESSFFPIPPHVILIPMVIARPDAWAKIAFVCSAASVAGAVLGYGIGAAAFEVAAKPILDAYGFLEGFEGFAEEFNERGVWAVLFAGATPFPFKVITILAGATAMPFIPFVLASIVARFAIFFLIAALLWKIGPPIREFVEKRLGLMATLRGRWV